MRAVWLLLVAVVAVAARPAAACLWDYDTFKEESIGQADIAAMVGGDLHKHSTAFYAGRVEYTRPMIDKGNAPKQRYDDLAVSLAKTGKLDDALAVLVDKDKRFPGEYTTEANRGTFLAMKGDVAGALEHLNKAIAINPDAHFGRETYQIKLLEYLGKLAKDPGLARRATFLDTIDIGTWAGEAKGITMMSKPPGTKRRVKVPTAPVVAIAGLMSFGDGHDNPHLWYALAWAFVVEQGDAQLALRAFRRAELLGHPRAGEDGAVLAGVLFEFRIACCRKPDDPKSQEVWAKLAKSYDEAWKRGAATNLERQRKEDARVARKEGKRVYGY